MSQFQRSGITSPEMFIKQVLQPRGFDLDDLERFMRHYIGLQELIATIGVGGKLVTPQEIRDLYKREHEELAASAVFFSASNYLAGVSAPPDAVMQFYTNRLANYRIPDRVQVSYVKFDLTNFLAEANQDMAKMTNLDAQIDEGYRQGGTNFLRQAKAQSLEEARRNIHDSTRESNLNCRAPGRRLSNLPPHSLTWSRCAQTTWASWPRRRVSPSKSPSHSTSTTGRRS